MRIFLWEGKKLKSNKITCVICGNEDQRGWGSSTAIGDICSNCSKLMFRKGITAGNIKYYMKHYNLDELREIILSNDNAKSNNTEYLYLLKGQNGQLYVYENKIEITRKGLCAFAYQGLKGTKTIPISEIKNIQLKLAKAFYGYIQFAVGGSIEDKWGLSGAYRDENTITFKSAFNKRAQDIKDYIENIILNKGNPQAAACTSTSGTNEVTDEIKKYKELLDIGAITPEEFDKKKKQLLDL